MRCQRLGSVAICGYMKNLNTALNSHLAKRHMYLMARP